MVENKIEQAKQAYRIQVEGLGEKAKKAYYILTAVATNRETIYYSDLAEQVGGVLARGLRNPCLDPISYQCRRNGFPDLACIVVLKETEFPSPESEFIPKTIALAWEAVWDFPWP